MKTCDIKGCEKPLGPGGANIGYTIPGKKLQTLAACASHTQFILSAPRGSYRITEGRTLEPITPAHRLFII